MAVGAHHDHGLDARHREVLALRPDDTVLTSSPSVTLPITTLPRGSGRRTRRSASHDPMSSHANAPTTTARRGLRSSTATSTATAFAAAKNPAASPAASAGHARLSSCAYAPASPRNRGTPQANRPVFHSAPRRRSRAARPAVGFSTKRRTARALPSGLPGTIYPYPVSLRV